MRRILSSRKHHWIARLGIVLIAIALIVGTVSCDGGGGGATYSLTMAVAPGGGGTATDLTGASPYAAGTSVNIKAVANPGYKFVSWSAPAGTFGSATAATTTFTMPAQNVTVAANFVAVYGLTMAVNPVGGGTATDLTGASPYAAGTSVNIKAVAAAPYQFVSWSAPAGTFGNATAAQTAFTMPAQNVTVEAHFVGPTDHFMGYFVDNDPMLYIGENVTLEDQFGAVNATVEWAWGFCNPAEKVHEVLTPIWNPDHHFTMYTLSYEGAPQQWFVQVNNQFGTQNLTVSGPVALAVPTRKVEPGNHEPPVGLDHYLIYMVDEGPLVEEFVDLNDEFGSQTDVYVYEPVLFANPVQKTHDGVVTEIVNPETHAVIYSIAGGYLEREVQVVNQFGLQALNVSGPYMLAVPSEKLYYQLIYDLTIASTAGGSVTTPGEGTFTYDEGMVVNLVATPALDHRFVNWTGDVSTIGNVNAAATNITMNGNYEITANFEVTPMVAAACAHTVGLKFDGTVVATGAPGGGYDFGQCNVGNWTGIMQVSAGHSYTVGLKSDGTVVAIGGGGAWDFGQCNVGNWTDIVQVVASPSDHTVGLKSDGTVVAVGHNDLGQCNVGGLTGIVQVAGGWHTVGLKSDGTVVAVGRNIEGQCNVGGWTDIVQVAACLWHTVGVKSNGTVVAVGYNSYGQCNVGGWTGIVQVEAGYYHTVGLKSDGTVVAVGGNQYGQCNVGGWTDIVQVVAGAWHTVGLKSDGTVVAVGGGIYDYGQCNVSGWDLN
jgi:hypothetical protein